MAGSCQAMAQSALTGHHLTAALTIFMVLSSPTEQRSPGCRNAMPPRTTTLKEKQEKASGNWEEVAPEASSGISVK